MPPPLIRPFVETADMEMPVMIVTRLAKETMQSPSISPAWPTTQVSLRKSMTPQMLRIHLMNTPLTQPILFALSLPAFFSKLSSSSS